MTPSFTCLLPLHRGGGRRPGSLVDAPQDCSTSEAWWPWRKRPCSRTVLTENICRRVQQRLQHRPATIPFLTTSTIKTFTHTSIPIHPCTLLKQTKSKTLNSPNMTPSFSCPLPVQCGGGRRPGSLAYTPQDCSTSETFSPRTVLTENICRCVQNILQHFPTTMAFLTTSTITLSCLDSAAPQADSW